MLSSVSVVPSSIAKPFPMCCLEISDGFKHRYKKNQIKSGGFKTNISEYLMQCYSNIAEMSGTEVIRKKKACRYL